MKVYDHIVIAVDSGETSKLALHEAIRLAKDQHTKLVIVHVVDLTFAGEGGMWVGLEEYIKTIRDAANALMSKYEKIVIKEGVKVESYVVEMTGPDDRIAEEIVAATKRLHGDLLVLGTHGRNGVRRFFLGSVAEEVIHIAKTPILLIRAKEKKE